MKKVPVDLIPTLLKEEEKLLEKNPLLYYQEKRPAFLDCSYKKKHDVPEGVYTAKILYIKCHTATVYRMKLELLSYKEDGKVIYGYGRRYKDDFSDLADCFGTEPVLHSKSTGYIGEVGMIHLTGSGWIEFIPRKLF